MVVTIPREHLQRKERASGGLSIKTCDSGRSLVVEIKCENLSIGCSTGVHWILPYLVSLQGVLA